MREAPAFVSDWRRKLHPVYNRRRQRAGENFDAAHACHRQRAHHRFERDFQQKHEKRSTDSFLDRHVSCHPDAISLIELKSLSNIHEREGVSHSPQTTDEEQYSHPVKPFESSRWFEGEKKTCANRWSVSNSFSLSTTARPDVLRGLRASGGSVSRYGRWLV